MKLETEIKRIERLAQEKSDENWRFRCFVKGSDLSIEALDAAVHKLYKTVSQQIDCQACANCCKVISPSLDDEDIKLLARHLDLSEDEFKGEYLERNKEDGEYYFKETPCRFLSGNCCTVFMFRPKICRSYPHLHKQEIFFRFSNVYSNCSVCPIVYNVYEQLKKELHFL